MKKSRLCINLLFVNMKIVEIFGICKHEDCRNILAKREWLILQSGIKGEKAWSGGDKGTLNRFTFPTMCAYN